MRPGVVVEGDHRAALRVLAYAVLANADLRFTVAGEIRRTFYLSFPDDGEDYDSSITASFISYEDAPQLL
jgi:hypothetical protein